jgi:hypothetical protein
MPRETGEAAASGRSANANGQARMQRADAAQLARDMLLCAMSTHGVMFAEQDTREFVRRARVFWSEVDSPTERPAEPKKPSDGDDDEPAEILVDDTIE